MNPSDTVRRFNDDDLPILMVRWAVPVPPGAPASAPERVFIDLTDNGSYAVRDGSGYCMNVAGEWVFEAPPSERDEAFLSFHRFRDQDHAFTVARHAAAAFAGGVRS